MKCLRKSPELMLKQKLQRSKTMTEELKQKAKEYAIYKHEYFVRNGGAK